MKKVICISSKFTNRDFTIGKIYELETLTRNETSIIDNMTHSFITEYIMDDNGIMAYYHFSLRLNFMSLKENRKEKIKKIRES